MIKCIKTGDSIMIREIIKPMKNSININIPDEYMNKKVEILVFPLDFENDDKKVIDFSKYSIEAFKDIDPIKWQQEIREEWDKNLE